MSIEATVARVTELEQMMSSSATGGAQAPAPQGFQAQLDQASASMAPTAATATAGATAPRNPGSRSPPPAPATPPGGAPAPGTLGSGSPSQFDGAIQAAASRNGVDPALLKGLIRAE